MIKNIALVAVATITACACVSSNAQAPDCPPGGQSKLFVGQYHLVFNEKMPICVTSPGIFMIEIKSVANSGVTVAKGGATVKAKNCDGVGIHGSNSLDADIIAVVVSDGADKGYECEFLITVDGLGVLDPRVRVVDNDTMLMLKSEAFSKALKLSNISADEAHDFVSTQKRAE